MKTRFLLLALSFLINTNSHSQIVTEDVIFDNYVSPSDNDLVNHFYGMQTLVQIPSNGISGGCLLAPDSNNWGNDNSIYCSKYESLTNSIFATSICFYYDTSVYNSSGFERAVSIWIQPQSDPNHYIIGTVSHNKKMEVYTYSTFQSDMQTLQLQHGNWYKFQLTFVFFNVPVPNTVQYFTKVENLGPFGINPPVLVDTLEGSLVDSVLVLDSAISVSITASQYGGTKYLDNFHYDGIKSSDSCLFSAIETQQTEIEKLKINIENNLLVITGPDLTGKLYGIYDLNGKKIIHSTITSETGHVDISELSAGFYILRISDSYNKSSYRFTVVK